MKGEEGCRRGGERRGVGEERREEEGFKPDLKVAMESASHRWTGSWSLSRGPGPHFTFIRDSTPTFS